MSPLRVIRTPTGKEQRAESTCYAAIQYILLGRPLALPTEVLARFPSRQRPPFSEIQQLAGKGRVHTTDEDIVLFVRNLNPAHYSLRPAGRAACLLGDEPIRMYVPLLIRPWIMQARRSIASCHLGTARTLCMLERFYWWIEMSVCTRWWLRRCLKCQARKTSQLTVRWPVISIPLPPGPGIAVSVDYFGPSPVTPRGNTYILLFTDRFSRRADMFAVTAAEFAAESTTNILIHQYILLWGCPRSILSDNGLQFCSKLSHVVYELEKPPPAPTIQAVKVVWSALTKQWPKWWLRSSTNAKTIGMRSCRTWSSLQQFGRRRHWPGPQRGSHGQAPAPPSHYFRPLRGRRPSEAGPRPPRILRPGARTPTARQRYCSRDACLNSFPCGTAKLGPLGRFAPGSQLRCG